MTLQIKSINSLEVKELMLAILLSTLIHESVQAQSVFSITRPSIQTPSVSITKPSIQTPSVSITRPSIQTPSVSITEPSIQTPSAFQLPTQFIVKSADGIIPSYVSAIEKNGVDKITTGTGSISIPIPNTSGNVSTINVVIPFERQIDDKSVEFTVDIVDSRINSVNFLVPALD
ncbi:MAG: hypothetical protein H9536_14040 [Aphanizomenon flos-aquae Clear-A1]|jgi:hypothetical protein|uniref:Uncharacterized protein n=1 Tax=Aphanizomenon flos-aquae WA102 TaxID=1710896 RepID=A0A1B7WRL3_APHFL|nr:hypothetical protein [Aphanizomenon flos-aquae Clear-A1]OBQ21162.1 MAG: hypothetical protein AN488_11150 [Anabaena sp. WA113]OBQ39732.1 MAG: hypothetical protein AN484_23030 [Aphanizomenon flos-aquae WA102]